MVKIGSILVSITETKSQMISFLRLLVKKKFSPKHRPNICCYCTTIWTKDHSLSNLFAVGHVAVVISEKKSEMKEKKEKNKEKNLD